MLSAAAEKARSTGRSDVAEYLSLKASNDTIRRLSVDWLFDTFLSRVSENGHPAVAVKIEKAEPHSFHYRGANIVGTAVWLRKGVRCLTVEAGWTRTPADGFMRGGGLAFARLRHFGLPRAGADLILTRADDIPVWRFLDSEGMAGEFNSDDAGRHVVLLTDG